jgi:hypothetical protein
MNALEEAQKRGESLRGLTQRGLGYLLDERGARALLAFEQVLVRVARIDSPLAPDEQVLESLISGLCVLLVRTDRGKGREHGPRALELLKRAVAVRVRFLTQ